jgi:hypothetical protein
VSAQFIFVHGPTSPSLRLQMIPSGPGLSLDDAFR